MRKFKNIIILAGGDSTRFWPLKNKMLTPFLGTPLLLHTIEVIAKYTEKLHVIAHKDTFSPLQQLIRETQKTEDLPIVVTKQREDIKGLGGAVATLDGAIEGEAVIVNASDFVNFSHIENFFDTLNSEKPDFILSVAKSANYFPGGYLKLDGEKIIEIIEKPKPGQEPSSLVKLVLDYCADIATFIQVIKSSQLAGRDSYEVAINELLRREKNVTYLEYSDYWYFLKYPWHVLSMMEHFLSTVSPRISNSAKVSQSASLEGAVYIDEGVTIGDYVKIVGPAYIGEGVVIGDHSLVRQSQVGKNSLIGAHCEVARSYLGERAMLHRNYVGDSVLAADVMMGAGAATANFRFDAGTISSQVGPEKIATDLAKLGAMIGEKSKIGVNATLLPGIKIGQNSLIGPGTLVTEDIEDNIFYHEGEKSKNRA